jgi:hypothetical protein
MCQKVVRLLQVCVILINSLILFNVKCFLGFRIALAIFQGEDFTHKFYVMKVQSKFHLSNRSKVWFSTLLDNKLVLCF